jgi:hypothetical protein
MTEERAEYGPRSGWRERLIEAAEQAVRNPHRETIIVLVYRAGVWRVVPTAPPAGKVAVNES